MPQKDAVSGIRRNLTMRHGGHDVTFVTQDEMVRVLGSVLGVLTFAVGALGSISLFARRRILTIMTIPVSERTSKIGAAERPRTSVTQRRAAPAKRGLAFQTRSGTP